MRCVQQNTGPGWRYGGMARSPASSGLLDPVACVATPMPPPVVMWILVAATSCGEGRIPSCEEARIPCCQAPNYSVWVARLLPATRPLGL